MYLQQIKPAEEHTELTIDVAGRVSEQVQPIILEPQASHDTSLIQQQIESRNGKNMIIFLPSGKGTEINEEISMIYECVSCSERFISDSTLRKHLLNEHEAQFCEECNMYFNADAYKEHIKVHAAQIQAPTVQVEKPSKTTCDICALEFGTKEIFDEHFVKFHEMDDDDYEVLSEDGGDAEAMDTTGHGFENAYENYEEIIEEEHVVVTKEEKNESPETVIEVFEMVASSEPAAADGKFYCSRCNAVFAKQLSLNIHFNSKKCLQQTFECDICHRVFAKKKNLALHIKTHTNQPELSCTACKAAFKEKQQYQVHMKSQHPNERKYRCTICPKCKSSTGESPLQHL